MLIVAIAVQSIESAQQQILAALPHADGIELRLDYLPHLRLAEVSVLRDLCTLPIIVTLRSRSQGGFYPNTESQRCKDILALCALQPDYLDLEYDMPASIVQSIHERYPAIKLICSYHDFQATALDLATLFHRMQGRYFYAYKIATYAQNTMDALRMLLFVKSVSAQHRISGLCMGADGVCTRIVGRVMGGMMTYACLDAGQEVASGQLTLTELLNVYHYRSLNSASRIYALLGDPVDLSVGHILHNQAMRYLQKNAIYIKLRIPQADFHSAWALCKDLGFSGMSVTMPLKETIFAVLDNTQGDASFIRAANTVIHEQAQYMGLNTDGLGAMQALMAYTDLKKKTIVILGAGGAARAIAYAARQQQAEVILLNRTLQAAQCIAAEWGCEAYPLSQLHELRSRYDIIINTLPQRVFFETDIQSLFHSNVLKPHSIAMDIVYQPIHTVFLQMAKQAHCCCIYGYDMYIHQALLQLEGWFCLDQPQKSALKAHMFRYFIGNQ